MSMPEDRQRVLWQNLFCFALKATSADRSLQLDRSPYPKILFCDIIKHHVFIEPCPFNATGPNSINSLPSTSWSLDSTPFPPPNSFTRLNTTFFSIEVPCSSFESTSITQSHKNPTPQKKKKQTKQRTWRSRPCKPNHGRVNLLPIGGNVPDPAVYPS